MSQEYTLRCNEQPADSVVNRCRNEAIVVAGSRACGKSHLIITDLLPRLSERCKKIRLYSPMRDEFDRYSLPKTDLTTCDTLSEDFRTDVVGTHHEPEPTLVILDDDAGTLLKQEKGLYRRLLVNGRCNNVTTVISLQYAEDLTRDLRANVDRIFLRAEERHLQAQFLTTWYKSFNLSPRYASFREFEKALLEALSANKGNGHVFIVFCRGSHETGGSVFLHAANASNPLSVV